MLSVRPQPSWSPPPALPATDEVAAPSLWNGVAEEIIELIAEYLAPGGNDVPWRPLDPESFEGPLDCHFKESMLLDVKSASVGAAHWLQLSHALTKSSWNDTLQAAQLSNCRPPGPRTRPAHRAPSG